MMEQIKEKFEHFIIPEEWNIERLRKFTNSLFELAYQYVQTVDERSFNEVDRPEKVADMVFHDPPKEQMNEEEIQSFLKQLIRNFPSTNSKNFVGYVPSNPVVQSMAIAALTPFFNQFTGSVQGSPGGTAIEALMIKWIADLLELSSDTFGCFTSGGSVANLTAIYTGLHHQLLQHDIDLQEDGLFGKKRPIIYISDQTHNAIEKSLLVLGLGRKSIRVIPSDDQFKLQSEAVQRAIQEDLNYGYLPIMIIATIGTTNTGSIDDIHGLKQVSDKFNMWLHVDGAYGAFTALAKLNISSESKLISLADSIALDCHKWLYTPFEAGIALVQEHQIMFRSYDLTAEYIKDSDLEDDITLQRNFRSYGIPLTRELRGLKVWAVFASLGVDGIKNAVTRDILKAKYLANLLKENPNFEVINQVEMSIVCFSYYKPELNKIIIQEINSRGNFFLSSTSINSDTIIRVCFLNRRSDLLTVDAFYEELIFVVNKVEINP